MLTFAEKQRKGTKTLVTECGKCASRDYYEGDEEGKEKERKNNKEEKKW